MHVTQLSRKRLFSLVPVDLGCSGLQSAPGAAIRSPPAGWRRRSAAGARRGATVRTNPPSCSSECWTKNWNSRKAPGESPVSRFVSVPLALLVEFVLLIDQSVGFGGWTQAFFFNLKWCWEFLPFYSVCRLFYCIYFNVSCLKAPIGWYKEH